MTAVSRPYMAGSFPQKTLQPGSKGQANMPHIPLAASDGIKKLSGTSANGTYPELNCLATLKLPCFDVHVLRNVTPAGGLTVHLLSLANYNACVERGKRVIPLLSVSRQSLIDRRHCDYLEDQQSDLV